MARKPLFWVVFAALGISGAVAAVRLFSVALPNITLDITMDRGEALESAAGLATEYGWGAGDDRSAASFGLVDAEVQTYVELEGGGRDAFVGLAERGVYEPYQWRVRRFAERRIEESITAFTPRGEPYGFRLRVSEDDSAGGSVDGPAARAIAEGLASEWGVDLAAYRLLDQSQERLPSGRVDHTLVYERTLETAGEARFRLRLRVAGSRPAELTHFVFVPEAFSRRYADMRATNDTIALVSQAVFMLLFVLLGAGVGSALLLRRRWLEWRAPLAWGGLIAFLFGLNNINQLPLSWMSYDTALSATNFVLQQLGAGVAIGLLGTPLIAFFLLAGESLGRRAFAGHVQQWRFWSPEVASSSTAAGMTIAAYLLVGLQLGYVMLFYLGTQRLEGWWSPADALVQPDLLATYFPWLQAVSVALFAAFWEESVFRAVPIACAAILGARYGRRSAWIWGAVLLQAVVFAAAHANYPQQPPYARVVELTAPALLWGAVYVRYGLVPTVLAHFLYDLSLFSIVLFESDAVVDQTVVVAVALLPLAVVGVRRLREGGRPRPPEWAFNGAWAPPASAPDEADRPVAVEEPEQGPGPTPERSSRLEAWPVPPWVAPLAGVAGAVLWLSVQWVTPPPPRLWGSRADARAIALSELSARGAPVDAWSLSVAATGGPTEGREYVWEVAGRDAYTELSGTYFDVPQWLVRLVDWDADPEARVEEYRVWVGEDGDIIRFRHVLPEGRPGAALDGEAARRLAVAAASERLGVPPERLREVEAEATSLPSRTDWTFTFAETGLLEEVEGEARVQVRLGGEEVVDVGRTVRVPEEWVRERRQAQSRQLIMRGGLGLLLAVLFGAAAITAIVTWSRGSLAAGVGTRLALPVLAAIALSAANAWPSTLAGLSTAQPWGLQVGSLAIALLVGVAVAAPAIGLVGALAVTWLGEEPLPTARPGLAVGLGLLLGGALAAATRLMATVPALPDYTGAAGALPFLDAPLGMVTAYLLVTTAVLMLVAARRRLRGQPMIQSLITTLLVVSAVVVVPSSMQSSPATWGLAALGIGMALFLAVRVASAEPTLVPAVLGTALALQSLTSVWDAPYAGSRLGGVIAAALLIALSWAVTALLVPSGGGAGARSQSRAATRASVGSE